MKTMIMHVNQIRFQGLRKSNRERAGQEGSTGAVKLLLNVQVDVNIFEFGSRLLPLNP